MRLVRPSFDPMLRFGGGAAPPPPPPAAPAQNPPDLKAQDQAADALRLQKGKVGRASDVLTSPLGDVGSDQNLAKKYLGA